MLFLMLSGTIIGIFGFVLDSNYSLDGCITYGMYIALTVMSLYTIQKFDTQKLRSEFYNWAKAILIASVYAVAFCYIMGFRSAYGTQETIVSLDIWYFACILIPGFFYIKERVSCLLAIILMVPLYLFSSGGKSVMILAVVLCFFAYSFKISSSLGNKFKDLSKLSILKSSRF